MSDQELLDRAERAARGIALPDGRFDDLLRRRDRKRRNQRIAAGVVGIAVFVAAVWIVTSGAWFDRTQTPAVPGGAETGPKVTNPTPKSAVGPVPETDYLLDLNTGETTPMPESIVGTEDVTFDYAVSPDGSRLAYVGPGDKGLQIFVANLDGTGIEQQVTMELQGNALPSSDVAPAWSPDGSKIAYIGGGGNALSHVYMLDLATGVSTQVTHDPREYANAASFSPDGSFIVYSVHDQVLTVSVAGGPSVPLVGGDAQLPGHLPALSPDGSLLSYTCEDALCLANADGTDARVFVGGGLLGDVAGSWSPDGTRIAYWVYRSGVWVVDVATGEVTLVAMDAAYPTWLDNHTLIVETDFCSRPHNNCGG